jgi:hypothetical protein
MRYLAFVMLAACAAEPSDPEPGTPDAPEPLAGDQTPPVGHAELVPWLATGVYKSWACEPEAHPARPPGAHGSNRICSNTLLSATASGAYPVGAASVKELVRNGEVTGYAVMRKLEDGTEANRWYWYEAFGTSVVADGRSPGICTGCHGDAPRDHIFTRVE